MKPASMCLPAALLAAFIGVLAPGTTRAAPPAFAVQAEPISLRRPDANQFTDCSLVGPNGVGPASRPATTSDSIRTGPGSDEPTTLVDGSDPDTDRAVSTALNVATCVLEVAGAVVVAVMLFRMADVLHSATPLATGAGR